VFAQDTGVPGSSYGWEPSSSANSEKPGIHSRMRNRETSGTSNSETIEPGDFAVTGGVSSRAWNPTGQVDPGTSNSPAGNAGGE
jgi:hypothetical protein